MSDLVTFLTARLDEDAAGAWAVHDVSKCDALLYEEDLAAGAREGHCDCGYPARVLREVEADRMLLGAYEHAQAKYDSKVTMGSMAEDRWLAGEVFGLLTAVQVRAAVYSDHEGYRDEWRP